MTLLSAGKMKRFALCLAGLAMLAACEPADERAQSHLQNGQKLAAEGDTARALLEYREAVRLNVNLAPAYIAIAEIRTAEGNMQSAVGHYMKAVEVDEGNVTARIKLGQIMLAAGQLDEALKYAMTAAQLAPQNVQALTLRASVGVQVENFDLATESANKALAIDPTASDAQIVLAAIDQRNGKLAEARARVEKALAADPNHLALNLYLMRLLEQSGEKAGIPVILKRLVKAYPDRQQFHSALVRWHLSNGDKEGAESAVRAYAATRPEDPNAGLAVAQFLLAQSGVDAAKAELTKQLESRRGTPDAFPFEMALVRLNLAEGKTEDAAAQLKAMIAAYGDAGNGDTARVRLAAVELSRNDSQAAVGLIDAVLKHDARNAEALALRAQLKLAEDRYDAAIQDIRLAIAEDPKNWRYLMLEAKAQELNGSQSIAGERLGTAVQVSNYEPVAVLAYSQHLRATGKGDFAEGLLESALRRKQSDPSLLKELAQLKLARQDWIGAEDVAKQLRDVQGGGQVADLISAQSLAGQDQKAKSIEVLENLYQEGGGSGSSMAALVSSYVRSGQGERARAFLEKILAETPDNLTALQLKGAMHAALGEKVAAEKAYRAVLDAAPKAPAAYSALVQFLIAEQRFDDALDVARKGVDATGVAALQLSYALLLQRRGDIEEAIKVYETLYEARPDSYVTANNLASLLIDNFPTPENIERAFNVAKRLRASEVPQYQDTYGWLLYLRGEPEQALRHLQPAAEALPNEMLVQFHLGMAYAKAGVAERAVKSLERAMELAGDKADSKQASEARATLAALKSAAGKKKAAN